MSVYTLKRSLVLNGGQLEIREVTDWHDLTTLVPVTIQRQLNFNLPNRSEIINFLHSAFI